MIIGGLVQPVHTKKQIVLPCWQRQRAFAPVLARHCIAR